ncbi:MAG: hypothetical protein ACKOYQ_10620 [Actinomycetota bacterium]
MSEATPRQALIARAQASASAEDLATMAQHDDPEVRAAVAGNPLTRQDTIDQLAFDDDWRVPAACAVNPATGSFSLGELTRDDDVRVRERVALNAGLSVKDMHRARPPG